MEPSGAVLALAHDTTPLSAESALFEEMLAGWRRQQISRRLGASLIDQRERTLRRFQAFADGWPWAWRPEQLERWVAQGVGRIRRCGPIRARSRRSAAMPPTPATAGWG